MENKDLGSSKESFQEKINNLKDFITHPHNILYGKEPWIKAHFYPQLITLEEMVTMGIEGERYTGEPTTVACILSTLCQLIIDRDPNEQIAMNLRKIGTGNRVKYLN